MPDLKYIMRVASGLSPKRFLHLLDVDRRKSGKRAVPLLADMAWCAARYGTSFNDYMIFSYWELNHEQRAAILTRVKAHRLFDKVNDPDDTNIFDSKSAFYRVFADYLGRETLIVADTTPEVFSAFFERNPVILAKPDIGWSGKGIRHLVLEDYPTTEAREALFQELVAAKMGVIDAWIVQHPDLDILNPATVNSLRMCTFVDGDHADLLYSVLKVGTPGHYVDNLCSGGVHSPIDPDTGKLFYAGRNEERDFTDVSPSTGVPLVGFQVPFFHEATEYVKKLAMIIPSVRYVGWDIAITPTGPLVIEGNPYPGSFFWQLPQYGPKAGGLWPYFKAHVPGLR